MLFIPSKFEKHPIRPVQFLVIFVSGAKETLTGDEENYEENKTNFEGAYLKDSWTNLAQIWYGRGVPPQEIFHRKKRLFLFSCYCSKNAHFLVSCKIHTFLSHAQTHWLSLTTQHTIMYNCSKCISCFLVATCLFTLHKCTCTVIKNYKHCVTLLYISTQKKTAKL